MTHAQVIIQAPFGPATPAEALEAFLNPQRMSIGEQSKLFSALVETGSPEAYQAARFVSVNPSYYPGTMRTKAAEFLAKQPRGPQMVRDHLHLLEMFSSVGVGAYMILTFKEEYPHAVHWLFKFSAFDLGDRYIEIEMVRQRGRWGKTSRSIGVKTMGPWLSYHIRKTMADRLRDMIESVQI